MATRNSSEVKRRCLRVRSKRTQARPSTQASHAEAGSSLPRNFYSRRKGVLCQTHQVTQPRSRPATRPNQTAHACSD